MAEPTTNYAKHSTHSLSAAVQSAGYLGSLKAAFQACQIDGFWQRLDKHIEQVNLPNEDPLLKAANPDKTDRQDLTAASKTALGLTSLLNEDPHAIDVLPSGELGLLMQRLMEPTADKDGNHVSANKELVFKLNEKYNPTSDPGFVQHTMPKYKQLFESIENDPLIRNARQNWESYPPEAKLMVADRIGELQASAFGYKKYDAVAADLPADTDAHTLDPSEDENGRPINGKIEINSQSLSTTAGPEFAEFVDTLVHENEHAFQKTVIDKTVDILHEEIAWLKENKQEVGQMTPQMMKAFNSHMESWADKNLEGGSKNETNQALMYGGDLRSYGFVMQTSNLLYNEAFDSSHEAYESNPLEKHAFGIGSVAQNYFSSPEGKEKVLKTMETSLNDSQQTLAKNKADLSGYTNEAACNKMAAPGLGH